jgi:hypothetical protein
MINKIIKYSNKFLSIQIKMNLVKLTPENANKYIGYEIIFKTRKQHLIKKIISVSDTGKSIQIDHPDLNNNLQIVTRKVYVIIE